MQILRKIRTLKLSGLTRKYWQNKAQNFPKIHLRFLQLTILNQIHSVYNRKWCEITTSEALCTHFLNFQKKIPISSFLKKIGENFTSVSYRPFIILNQVWSVISISYWSTKSLRLLNIYILNQYKSSDSFSETKL